MKQDAEDKISRVSGFLKRGGLKVARKENVLRTRVNTGALVDVFSLKNNPDRIRARIKTKEADSLKRQIFVESTQTAFSKVLQDKVRVDVFNLSREVDGAYIYLADIELAPGGEDDEAFELPEDAVEIVETQASEQNAGPDQSEMPLEMSLEMSDAAVSNGPESDGNLAEFALDFTPPAENPEPKKKSLAEQAFEHIETVDSKSLRQCLDMMALKRTGAVRLAITRIFRNSLEVAELEKTVHREAKKILSEADRAELKAVKSVGGNGFLDPVITMLWNEVFQ